MTVEQELIRSLAKKYNINIEQAEEIVYSQHKFLAHIMKNKSNRDKIHFPSVRIIGMGIFYCPDNIKKKLHYLKQEKDETTD